MRTSLQQLHHAARHDDRLRHARPGRGDDARPARRGDARRQAPAGRRAADACTTSRRTSFVAAFIGSPSMNLVEATIERRHGRVRRLHDPARPRAPAARRATTAASIVGIRPGGVRGRRVRRRAACRRSRCTVEVLEELGSDALRLLPPSTPSRSSSRTRCPTSRRTRRRSSPTRATAALFAARVDPRTEARVGGHDPARGRPVAALLLLARDRREPAERPRRRRGVA